MLVDSILRLSMYRCFVKNKNKNSNSSNLVLSFSEKNPDRLPLHVLEDSKDGYSEIVLSEHASPIKTSRDVNKISDQKLIPLATT